MEKWLLRLPIVMMGGMIVLSSELLVVPADTPLASFYGQLEVIAHLILYFSLGLFVARYVSKSLQISALGTLVLSGSLCAAFGVLEELHQTFVAARSAQFWDVLWDLVGGTLGSLVYLMLVGLLRWVKEFLSSAQVGVGTVLLRTTIALVVWLGICVPAVIHAGTIADLVRLVTTEGAYCGLQVVESSLQKIHSINSSRQRLNEASINGSPRKSVRATAHEASPQIRTAYGDISEEPAVTVARMDRHTDVQVIAESTTERMREQIAQQVQEELMRDLTKVLSQLQRSEGLDPSLVSTAKQALTSRAYAAASNDAGKNGMVREKIMQALGAKKPGANRGAQASWHETQPNSEPRLLGMGTREPDPVDVVTLITHPGNPVRGLTLDQVRKIFSGDYTNWSQVNGPDLAITVVIPRKQAGDTEKSLTDHLNASPAPSATRLPYLSLMIPVVAQTAGAVGFLPVKNTEQLEFVMGHKAFNRIAIKKDDQSPAVVPSTVALTTGEYPIMK
ncbi:MAG: VanZ family protein [Deltaproteobacteria bacterium]|nr:VanZ family protein [Deltaproteobacteria bacterium]